LISVKIGHSLDPLILKIYSVIFKKRVINPNIFTIAGLFCGFLAALAISFGYLRIGGSMIIVSGVFDLMDGTIARCSERVTDFGGFLDSVLDRYSDLLIMLGIFIYYLQLHHVLYMILVFVASIGIAIIPYARARAEAALLGCKTGLLERPERLILLIIGLLFDILGYVIIFLAIMTHITVIQRIFFVKKEALKHSKV